MAQQYRFECWYSEPVTVKHHRIGESAKHNSSLTQQVTLVLSWKSIPYSNYNSESEALYQIGKYIIPRPLQFASTNHHESLVFLPAGDILVQTINNAAGNTRVAHMTPRNVGKVRHTFQQVSLHAHNWVGSDIRHQSDKAAELACIRQRPNVASTIHPSV